MGFDEHQGQLLFEIPVYRMSPEVWHEEITEAIAHFERWSYHSDPLKRSDHAHRLAQLDRGFASAAYNQVMAWLRIVWDGPGPVVKGYAYRVTQQRIVRNFKPQRYEWCGKELEVWFTDEDSSADIGSEIRKEILETCRKGNIFYRRYVDLTAFDSVAPHVDWRAVIGLGVK